VASISSLEVSVAVTASSVTLRVCRRYQTEEWQHCLSYLIEKDHYCSASYLANLLLLGVAECQSIV